MSRLLSSDASSQHEQVRAYGARLLAESREELTRADGKAQVLLGIVGVGLGAVTGGLLAGSWSPFRLSNAVEWLWWTGIAAAVTAMVLIAAAVYPRSSGRRPMNGDQISYFADLSGFASGRAVTEGLRRSAAHDLERMGDQLHRISRIVETKYRLIRWGFWLMLAALVATVGSVLVNLALT